MPQEKRRETPWGHEDVIFRGERVTVKVITVQPSQRLSLQRHKRRDERWTVLSAAGGVLTIGKTNLPAEHGATAVIKRGVLHRMSALPEGELKVLEVAFGEFDQNDIERLEDDYGRI